MSELLEPARRVAALATELATELGDPNFAAGILRAAVSMIGSGERAASLGHAKAWRARVMLFNSLGSLEADSMPEAEPDVLPDTRLVSLLAVGRWVRSSASAFHDLPLVGLDDGTLNYSIKSLRVSLSRNAGTCWWNLPYAVNGEQWRAAVRVQRAEV